MHILSTINIIIGDKTAAAWLQEQTCTGITIVFAPDWGGETQELTYLYSIDW